MDYQSLKDVLMRKSLEELYALKGEQYGSREALIEDIIAHDDGCLGEILEFERSLLFLLLGRRRYPSQVDGKEATADGG